VPEGAERARDVRVLQRTHHLDLGAHVVSRRARVALEHFDSDTLARSLARGEVDCAEAAAELLADGERVNVSSKATTVDSRKPRGGDWWQLLPLHLGLFG
jgi:hypothetical protein